MFMRRASIAVLMVEVRRASVGGVGRGHEACFYRGVAGEPCFDGGVAGDEACLDRDVGGEGCFDRGVVGGDETCFDRGCWR